MTARTILHVDMDAFYASVEQRDDPSLRGRPVIVGGPSKRGVVCAASYEARPSGVRSAMPMGEALRLCPDAVVIAPRMDRYAETSRAIFAVFRRFTPLVEGLSLDEAFLDATESQALFGDGREIAARIKQAIREETGLSASAGVAPCKFVAKVASDLRKPDALVVVAQGEVASFLAPLPIERMWGVGPKTAPRLRRLGYATLGDLARAEPAALEGALGRWGPIARALARGDDPRAVEPSREAKSIGAEVTYERDLTERADIERTLLAHAARVAQRLVHEGLAARIVVIKLKRADFSIVTRRATLPQPVMDTDTIFEAAKRLLGDVDLAGARVRLTGVTVSALTSGPPPRTLFPDPAAERRRALEQAVARVKDRFDTPAITRGSLLEPRRR